MAASSGQDKRCLYQVLGLKLDCTPEEIRSAYKKLALQRHPDKLIQSGIPPSEATSLFQELVNAYEVLSDPRERSWYDSHRSQILFSGSSPSGSSSSLPNLFSFFFNSAFSGYSDSGKGFYKVYADLFDKIYDQELLFAKKLGLGLGSVKEAPVMGNLDSPYTQVTAFYNYWLGFSTLMDFCWVDQYDSAAGPNRKSRRVMEEENKKLRRKAKREYNDTVRGLAEFVKKRDKRVIDMRIRKNLEEEKKREEERMRKKEAERMKLERAKRYEEPEWAKIEDIDGVENGCELEEEEKKSVGSGKELYCVVCGKKFKSEKQWKNHEQSKKHREKVAEYRSSFADEEIGEEEDDDDEEEEGREEGGVDELEEKFRDNCGVDEEDGGDESPSGDQEFDVDNTNDTKPDNGLLGSDYETSVLEAMVSGHKTRKNGPSEPSLPETYVESEGEEIDLIEYSNRKGSRRNRRNRKEKPERSDKENKGVDVNEANTQIEENKGVDESTGRENHHAERYQKISSQQVSSKGTKKKEANAKAKDSAKGKKQKVRELHVSLYASFIVDISFVNSLKQIVQIFETASPLAG